MSDYMGRTLEDALARAQQDRKELLHIVQVVPSDYDRIIMAKEIEKLKREVEILWPQVNRADEQWDALVDERDKYKDGYDAAMRILKSTYPDKFPDAYFISGEGGRKDENGLPKQIHVCPAYGVDWFQIYERTDKTHGPEW